MNKHDVSHYQVILVIDTTGQDVTRVALLQGDKATTQVKNCRAQDLPVLIGELLESCGVTLNQIKALAVLEGPGSFTGIRIGITTANTLSWLYKLPIIAVPHAEFDRALEELPKGGPFQVTKVLLPQN
jgi:tRNA threonylcarbamoyl adenosine modification protein YeaZ